MSELSSVGKDGGRRGRADETPVTRVVPLHRTRTLTTSSNSILHVTTSKNGEIRQASHGGSGFHKGRTIKINSPVTREDPLVVDEDSQV